MCEADQGNALPRDQCLYAWTLRLISNVQNILLLNIHLYQFHWLWYGECRYLERLQGTEDHQCYSMFLCAFVGEIQSVCWRLIIMCDETDGEVGRFMRYLSEAGWTNSLPLNLKRQQTILQAHWGFRGEDFNHHKIGFCVMPISVASNLLGVQWNRLAERFFWKLEGSRR